ncbi:hypothetical protein GCM10009804_01340 [Kribbella hippodromi]|uniref:DUF998 domain-containing protein n=1 Tax=Kribbella hippodromi TaxID=434347 RepID=A0ABN2BZD3_9ACTN
MFFLAPFVGEFLLGNQPITAFGSIFLFAPMYGGGAVLIRELARRFGLGWSGIVILAVAYGLAEEGPIDQMLFNPGYLNLDSFAGMAEIPGLQLSLTLLQGTVTLHTIWSICVPIALVEACAPGVQRPWLRRGGLTAVAVVFVVGSTLLGILQALGFHFVASPAQFVVSAVIIVVLIVLAFVIGRRTHRPLAGQVPRPLVVGLTGFAVTSVFWLESVLFPDGVGSEWISASWWFVLFGTATAGIVRWARRGSWTPYHTLALATGALLTYAWAGFAHARELDGTSLPIALAGNTVFALIAIGLAVFARHRLVSQTPS